MRREHGFTLIEVVIAAGLLVALCTGTVMVLMLTLNTIDRSRHRAMALVLARAKLEEVLSLTWSVRNIGGVPVLLTDEGTQSADLVDYPNAGRYTRRWTITHTGTGASELLIVQVRVCATQDDRDAVWIAGARLRRGG